MSKCRWFQVVALLAIVSFCVCSQMAFARAHAVVVPRAHSDVASYPPTPGLYAVNQAFAGSPYPNWITNTDGVELWPCFGDNGGNLDCPTIGNLPDPFSGIAVGVPSYTWSLADCDGTTNGTQNPYVQGETWNPLAINTYYIPCGQINTFYQDYTGDTTDDILWTAVVTQGASVIADTGIQDWGPNGFGANPGQLIVFYQDFNFGALGVSGANNGNCVGDYNYPTSSPSPTNPLVYPVITAAGKTCSDPVAGPATIKVTTEVATPTWTCRTNHSVTTCTVRYAKVSSVIQTWSIYLQ